MNICFLHASGKRPGSLPPCNCDHEGIHIVQWLYNLHAISGPNAKSQTEVCHERWMEGLSFILQSIRALTTGPSAIEMSSLPVSFNDVLWVYCNSATSNCTFVWISRTTVYIYMSLDAEL